MRNRIALSMCLLAFLIFLTGMCQAQPQKPAPSPKPKPPKLAPRVLLISISGLRADQANAPESFRLKLPNLQSLQAKGSRAVGVESVYPSQRIPAHVSMVTGMLPADHGVTSDYPFDEQTGTQSTTSFQSAKAIKSDTIWEAAKRENLMTAAVGFPMTDDSNITFNSAENHNQSDAAKTESAISLIEQHLPNLLAINFTSLDEAQRRFGILSKESNAALELIDGLVGKIVAAVERARLSSEYAFLIVSDHGASKVEREFRPNVLLAKKGFLTTDGQGNIKSWRAVAQSFGGSAAIFLKTPQDESTAREVLALFTELEKDSDNPLWRITIRREAARLGADSRPAIYLDAAPLFQFSSRASGSAFSKTDERSAYGHLPSRAEMRGAFILSGKAIKPGQRIEYTRLIDVAPTIARLLGLEMKTTRGRVLLEVIAQ